MRVHHLDCCTMCPVGQRAINGHGKPFARGRLVGHCLLIETRAHGLVLVDTGIGVGDVRNPGGLGLLFGPAMGIDASQTQMPLIAQLTAMGFQRDDVRHIVLTHLDFDHAGGLPDFPKAHVHVHVREREAALSRARFNDRLRYRQHHLAHAPVWSAYDGVGEPWKGARAIPLEGLPPEILAVPTHGHSGGHVAVAVDAGDGWLLHAGDAYFHRSEALRGDTAEMPWALRRVERFIARDYARVRENHRILAELARQPGVKVFSAHDPVEFDALAGSR